MTLFQNLMKVNAMVVEQDLCSDQLKRVVFHQQNSKVFFEHRNFRKAMYADETGSISDVVSAEVDEGDKAAGGVGKCGARGPLCTRPAEYSAG